MRSRWTDFLTSDGEKPDRNRDGEFLDPSPTRQALLETWQDGWERLFEALELLSEADLVRTVTIRGEPHSVMQAINRQSRALRASCGTNRSAGEAFRRPSMEIAERAQESICGIQPAGGIGTSGARDKLQNLIVLRKVLTATLLVPLHRIPPPKESMKMFRGESPLEDEHSGSVEISYGS